MAVLVKGIEMPAMCSECDFCGGLILPDNIYTCDCPSEKIHGKNITRAIEEDCRHPNCPLIEVPEPHGRLGDLDAVAKQIDYMANLDWNKKVGASGGMLAALETVEDAPTVIPASEEG